jgi:hypothetical protein
MSSLHAAIQPIFCMEEKLEVLVQYEIEMYFGGGENSEVPESMTLTTVEFGTVTELTVHAYRELKRLGATGVSFGPVVPRNSDGTVAHQKTSY